MTPQKFDAELQGPQNLLAEMSLKTRSVIRNIVRSGIHTPPTPPDARMYVASRVRVTGEYVGVTVGAEDALVLREIRRALPGLVGDESAQRQVAVTTLLLR